MGWRFLDRIAVPFTQTLNPNQQMSHFTTIKTQIKDIGALRSACHELGLSLLQNAEARGYYQNKIKGDFVVQLKGPYDIALNKEPDGSFGLTADLWGGHVEAEVGPNYGKLLQLYGVHKAIKLQELAVVRADYGKLLQLYGVHKAIQQARKKGHLGR